MILRGKRVRVHIIQPEGRTKAVSGKLTDAYEGTVSGPAKLADSVGRLIVVPAHSIEFVEEL